MKRSLNLTFDFVREDQGVGGYRTFNLLNASGDPTFTRGVLYSEIARHYIPAPATNYMRVVINGESWGIYLNAQQFNKDFTRDYFQSTKGARWHVPGSPGARGGWEYLGDDAAAYKGTYEIKSKDDPQSWTDLIAVFRVLNQTPADRLEAALAPMLDVDGVLKFLALENALVNSDGYWARASDYNIYQDERGVFHVIPHDMNEGLAEEGIPGDPPGPPGFAPPPGFAGRAARGAGFALPAVDLDPLVGLDDESKPLRSKLLAVPALRQRYLGYVREIATEWLDWKNLEPRLRQYQALIVDDVRSDVRKLYDFELFDAVGPATGDSVKNFADRRRAYLLRN
jgi:hypothetical protein